MPTYNFDISGVAPSLQYGLGGGVLVWNTNHFESTSNGSTLANLRIPLTPLNANDAASKNYVDTLPQPYDIGVFYPLQAPVGTSIITYTFPRTVTFLNNFSGSVGTVQTNPTAAYTCDIQRNNVSIGSLSVATSGSVTFATTGTATETFSAGNTLKIVAPASADATLDGLSITLVGSR